MPRAKIWGILSVFFSLMLGGLFVYAFFGNYGHYQSPLELNVLQPITYYAVAVPIGLVAIIVLATGFWIGLTIITIKVVPPMPEIVEKKDYSKFKAVVLCLSTLAVAVLLGYGIYIKSYWALAIPAFVISFVVLGAVFWVGIAIITTRSTLPEEKE